LIGRTSILIGLKAVSGSGYFQQLGHRDRQRRRWSRLRRSTGARRL
jgi:hypothetical protein